MPELHPPLTEHGHWRDPSSPVPRLVVLSGSGLSVESGMSLYRASEGLWENHDVNQVCNIRTWRANAPVVHQFYNTLRAKSARATPHAGHRLLVDLETEGAVLVTQNVDTLLEQAGAHHVLHLHGTLDRMLCTACSHRWTVPKTTEWVWEADPCPVCNSRQDVKPDVVFFGEQAPGYNPWRNLLSELRPQDVLLTIGSSGEVVNPLSMGGPNQQWLANLNASPALPDYAFQKIWYAPITQSSKEIASTWAEYVRTA